MFVIITDITLSSKASLLNYSKDEVTSLDSGFPFMKIMLFVNFHLLMYICLDLNGWMFFKFLDLLEVITASNWFYASITRSFERVVFR